MLIAHATLATRDVERTVEFFTATLGWRPIPSPANSPLRLRAAWLDVGGGQQLHLLLVEDFAPSPFEGEFGRHLAFLHPGEDMAALRRRLIEHGARIIPAMRQTPFDRIFFRDPNGYVFEIINREQYAPEQ